MASTIQLKRGSGAPTGGDLAAGEPALDLTNNKLYSSTDGTDVVEIGFDGQFSDGSITAPSITFSSDTDTGIYRSASNTLDVVAGGGSSGYRCVSFGKFYNYFSPDIVAASISQLISHGTFLCNVNAGYAPYNIWQFSYAGSSVGGIQINTTSTFFATTSDYRLKENVAPIENAVARIDNLNPVRFNFISDPSHTVDGFLAHEVTPVVPEAISGEKDAVDEDGNPVYQSIDQSKLVPLLVAAIQELSARVAALEAN